jgi:hypothetical protein
VVGSNDGEGQSAAEDIPIVKTVDKSSPKLMMNKSTAPRDAATGQASGKRK